MMKFCSKDILRGPDLGISLDWSSIFISGSGSLVDCFQIPKYMWSFYSISSLVTCEVRIRKCDWGTTFSVCFLPKHWKVILNLKLHIFFFLTRVHGFFGSTTYVKLCCSFIHLNSINSMGQQPHPQFFLEMPSIFVFFFSFLFHPISFPTSLIWIMGFS